MSYADVLTTARQNIPLTEIGVGSVDMKKAMTVEWAGIAVVGVYVSPNSGLVAFGDFLDGVGECVRRSTTGEWPRGLKFYPTTSTY